MIDSTHQGLDYPFHLQFEEEGAHAAYRDVGFHHQGVDMEVATTTQYLHHKALFRGEIQEEVALYSFGARGARAAPP